MDHVFAPPPAGEGSPPHAEPFAAVLRRARERAGLSQRDLARAIGVSSATVAAAELGADPRRSTLERLAHGLPLLDPRRLLSDAEAVVPSRTGSCWETMRDLVSLRAEKASVRRRVAAREATVVDVEGVEDESSSEGAPGRVPASVLRAVFAGESESLDRLMREPWPARSSVSTDDPCGTHSFERGPRGQGITYRLRSEAACEPDAAALVGWIPTLPVGLLALEVEAPLPPPCAPTLTVRVPALPEHPPAAVPAAVSSCSADRRAVFASLRRPLPFLRYELRWPARATEAILPSGTPPASPAVALRQARERAGLSCRALASRLGLSVATVHGAENGLDMRRSTLVALLSALPTLRAEDLIPSGEPSRSSTRAEAWETYRQLMGVEAASLERRVVLTPDGRARVVTRTTGLRRLRACDAPFVLLRRLQSGEEPGAIEALGGGWTASSETVMADGGRHERVRLTGASPDEAVTIERVSACAAPSLTPEGTSRLELCAPMPTRLLVLEVELPQGKAGIGFQAIGGYGHRALDVDVETAQSGRVARLSVPEPIVGMPYGLEWKVA